MATSTPSPPTPRFHLAAPPRKGRWRVPVVGAALLAVAGGIVALGWPSTKAALRCQDGRLLVDTSGFPGVEVSRERLPPLPAPAVRCLDERFRSRTDLEHRWVELALVAIDDALVTDDAGRLDAISPVLDAVARLTQGAESDRVETRRRSLLLARLRADVNAARGMKLRARARLQQAREAGLDPQLLEPLARALDPALAPEGHFALPTLPGVAPEERDVPPPEAKRERPL